LLQIKIDESFIQRDNYDECNALVIPSEKRRTKAKNNTVTVKRILSKSQRKRKCPELNYDVNKGTGILVARPVW
jgi:hypothetical protein